jgi:hypothetical protein
MYTKAECRHLTDAKRLNLVVHKVTARLQKLMHSSAT